MDGAEQGAPWPRATYADWLAMVRADAEGVDVSGLRTLLDTGVVLDALVHAGNVPAASLARAADHHGAAAPACALRLAWRTERLDLQAPPDGYALVRHCDPALCAALARGEGEHVGRLDATQHVLTLPSDDAGTRALATLARHGLPHAVVLDVLDRIDEPAPARELALTLAALVDVMRSLGDDALAARLFFPVRLCTDLLTQIAKVRAAAWLWHTVTHAVAPAATPRAARVWARASDLAFSAIDPELNLVRGALQMFAAAASGCFAFEPLLHDPLGNPSDSARLAANQLRLLHHESNALAVADPGGGAFVLESLTAQITHSAWEMFGAIERAGGASQTDGGRAVLPAAPARPRVLVGSNRFADPRARVGAAPPAVAARPAAPFEALRRRTAARPVAALVLPFGEPGPARAQAEWATDLLRTVGIEPQHAARCTTAAQAHAQLAAFPHACVLVCAGADDAAGGFVRSLMADLAPRQEAPLLYVTGRAPAGSEVWGAVGFLHPDLDLAGTLSGILDRLQLPPGA
jgi:methylmalonyl-CoA mutase